MTILGVETSCDDTGIALVKGSQQGCRILSNVVSSQIKIHAPYGGVVPNLAARAHLNNIQPCLKQALKQANQPKIDLIAVTIGPGLIPSLLVGVNFARALAYVWQKPIIGINHIEAHIYANWLKTAPVFPTLCLVVSGGHTQLILVKGHGKYQLLGQTRDDAAGEAFDKVAKLLNLGYPGGPIISQRAKKGNPQAIDLPRPMINSRDFDFSFSGLKTAVLYKIRPLGSFFEVRPFERDLASGKITTLNVKPKKRYSSRGQSFINDMAASFQQAAIDVLINKTIKAAKKYRVKTVMLSGGVAANQELRKQTEQAVKKELSKVKFQMPDIKLCTDNAVMTAIAACYKKKPDSKKSWLRIEADANLKLI